MAKMNISVPEDLRERMVGLNCNWSAIAQDAFAHAVRIEELKGAGDDTRAGLARLRGDKQRNSAIERAEGHQHGMTWALEDASYDELKNGVQSLDRTDAERVAAWVTGCLQRTSIALEGIPAPNPGLAYAEGFLEGASEILSQV